LNEGQPNTPATRDRDPRKPAEEGWRAFLAGRGDDVRDVCPNRTNERRRVRHGPKTDAADSVRIAWEVLAEPALPAAFRRAAGNAGPDELAELLERWHNERPSLRRSTQQLLNEAEALLGALPEEAWAGLPDPSDVRQRLRALGRRDRSARWDPPTALRLRLLDSHAAAIASLDAGSGRRRASWPASTAAPARP
jgi:hypothetical protein